MNEYKEIKKAAKLGDLYAQVRMGDLYYNGIRVRQNYKKAIEWYKKAAMYNDEPAAADAQLQLAKMYLEGKGTKKDELAGVKYMIKSAEYGFPDAQYELAMLYASYNEKYSDMLSDFFDSNEVVVTLLESAALHGQAKAQCALGRLYRVGKYVPQNYQLAKKWLDQAAQNGVAEAKNELGLMYLNGEGVQVDLLQAICYFSNAEEKGCIQARENYQLVKKMLNFR